MLSKTSMVTGRKALSDELRDIAAKMMLPHSSTRWVTIKKSCLRLLDQWPNLCEYFLRFLPTQKGFKSQIAETERYKRIVKVLEKQIYKAYFCFIAFTAEEFQAFLTEFQNAEPKVCHLYSSMGSLLYTLLSRFVLTKLLHDEQSNKPLDAKLLSLIDCSQKENRKKKKLIDVGTRAKSILLDSTVTEDQIAIFRQECQDFYVSSVTYLQSYLPMTSSVIKD